MVTEAPTEPATTMATRPATASRHRHHTNAARLIIAAVLVMAMALTALSIAPDTAEAHPGPHNHAPNGSGTGSEGTVTAGVPGVGAIQPGLSPRHRGICYAACAVGAIAATIATANPALGASVGLSCSASCAALDVATGVFNHRSQRQKRFEYRVRIDPRKNQTWSQIRTLTQRAIQSKPITPADVPDVNAFLKDFGEIARSLIPKGCYQQGQFRANRGTCSRWSEIHKTSVGLRNWRVSATSAGNGWKPNGHFECQGRQYYSNGQTAYRQLVDNGRTLCPGVVLKLHVYRGGKVIDTIYPGATGGSGSGGGAAGFPNGRHACKDLNGKSTGRTYKIVGNNYWQITGRSNTIYCPELRAAGKNFGYWYWDSNGRPKG